MKKNYINIIIIALCAVVMLFFAVAVDGPQSLIKAITSAKPVFLICAAACMVVYWVLEALAFYHVCKKMGSSISYKNCFQTSMVGQMFNCLTPFASGGQPMQAYRLVKCGMTIGKASCALLAKFIIYQSVLTLYSILVIIFKLNFFLNEISGFALVILIGFGANTVVMMFIVGIGFFPKPTTKFLLGTAKLLYKMKLVKDYEKLENRILDESNRFYKEFNELKSNLRHFIIPAIVTVLQLTIFFTVPYFVCLSLSAVGLNYVTVLCAAAFVLLISSFVPLPGGSGGAEGGFYLFFGMFFVQGGILPVAILLWRLLTFYLPIFVGMFFSRLVPKEKIDDTKTA